ncbi:MAG TPA: N-acetyltransferase [Firmicutes bacterium]|nr:N-acetyltransferase [Bacillota bacterium]
MIRKFEACDIEQVMRIWVKGNIEAHDFIPREYWEAHIPVVREQLLQAEAYVYETDGEIQGFIGMQGDYLAGIFVEKQSRSRGIGKQLLHYVKNIHSVLSLNVYQKNRRAVKFYQQEGFSVVSEDMDEATGQMDYTMSWNSRNCTMI